MNRVLVKEEPDKGLWALICLDYNLVTQARTPSAFMEVMERAVLIVGKSPKDLPLRYWEEFETSPIILKRPGWEFRLGYPTVART